MKLKYSFKEMLTNEVTVQKLTLKVEKDVMLKFSLLKIFKS